MYFGFIVLLVLIFSTTLAYTQELTAKDLFVPVAEKNNFSPVFKKFETQLQTLYSMPKNTSLDKFLNTKQKKEDFAKRIMEMTDNYGLDVVFNTLSGDAIQKGIDILAPGGRYVEIAMAGLKSSNSFNLSNMVNNQIFYNIVSFQVHC